VRSYSDHRNTVGAHAANLARANGSTSSRTIASLVGAMLLAAPPTAAAQDTSPAEELTARDIAARARSAVVLVTGLLEGVVVRQGSGFGVGGDGLLVTNHHVIDGADALRVQVASGEEFDDVYVRSSDQELDLALLRVPSANIDSLPLGDVGAVEIGDPVYAMGNPLGLEGTFSNGLLSNRRQTDTAELLQISAPISAGSSGGPVLNSRGEVIGIVTFTMRGGQNLNLALPIDYVRTMLAAYDKPVVPNLTDEDVVEPSADGSGGGGSASGDEGAEPRLEDLIAALEEQVTARDDFTLEASHDAIFKEIANRRSTVVDLDLEAGTKLVFGVCDSECIDINLTVYNPDGEVVAGDQNPDPHPVVGIDVPVSGRYGIRIHMLACASSPCDAAVRAYDAEPIPGAAPARARIASTGIVRTPRGGQPFVPSPELERELKGGFDDVAPGAWDRYVEMASRSDPVGVSAWSARAIVEYATAEEFLQVLAWRIDAYRKAADNPMARAACSFTARRFPADYSAFDLAPLARVSGRSLARDIVGRTPWRPRVDVAGNDAVWTAYVDYLLDNGYDHVLQGFMQIAEGGGSDDRAACLWQADFYEVAVRAPNRRIGPVTLLELVRSLELTGKAEVFSY